MSNKTKAPEEPQNVGEAQAAPTKTATPPDELEKLRAEIDKLEDRVHELEDQVEELEQANEALKQELDQARASQPAPPMPAGPTPEDWARACEQRRYVAFVHAPAPGERAARWEGPKDAPVWLGYPIVGEQQTLASLTIEGEGEVPLRLLFRDSRTRCGVYVRADVELEGIDR